MMNKCSIKREKALKTNGKTCLYEDELKIIANVIGNQKQINVEGPLYKFINKHMHGRCNENDEVCWLETLITYDAQISKILTHAYVPIGPHSSTTWLKTSQINKIMQQYEVCYDDFIYIGAATWDFYYLHEYYGPSINIFNKFLRNELSGITKCGLIINTDTFDKPGKHWVGIFITPLCIEYFDSNGREPSEKNIGKLLKDIIGSRKLKYNQKRLQHQSSECGMFAINFLIHKLNNSSKYENMSDEDMIKLRKKIFR